MGLSVSLSAGSLASVSLSEGSESSGVSGDRLEADVKDLESVDEGGDDDKESLVVAGLA